MAISAQLEEQQLELARLAAALGRQPLEADPVARLLLAADEAARSTERADACSLPEGEVRTGPWPGCKAGGGEWAAPGGPTVRWPPTAGTTT